MPPDRAMKTFYKVSIVTMSLNLKKCNVAACSGHLRALNCIVS